MLFSKFTKGPPCPLPSLSSPPPQRSIRPGAEARKEGSRLRGVRGIGCQWKATPQGQPEEREPGLGDPREVGEDLPAYTSEGWGPRALQE